MNRLPFFESEPASAHVVDVRAEALAPVRRESYVRSGLRWPLLPAGAPHPLANRSGCSCAAVGYASVHSALSGARPR